MFDGAEVVLGPDSSVELLGPVPPEQQFVNQKMRPGSGMLSIRVIPDGPTRALQVRIEGLTQLCLFPPIPLVSQIFSECTHAGCGLCCPPL